MRRLEDISAEDLVLTHTTIMSGLSKIFKFPGVIKKRRAVGHELPTLTSLKNEAVCYYSIYSITNVLLK